MAKILVSLLSAQTIPNVLFINELPKMDKYIFISTEEMKKNNKFNMIINACKIQQDIAVEKIVEEDNLDNISKILSQITFQDDDEIILNLTGGTKIMSISTYNFFKKMEATIYYLPIGKNEYLKIFPSSKKKHYSLNYRINVIDYLTAYGIEIKNKNTNKLFAPKEQTENIFKKYLNNEIDPHTFSEIKQLRNNNRLKNGKTISVEESHKPYLKNLGFKNIVCWTKDLVDYLTGGWFEEYTYTLIKDYGKLDNNYIAINLNITKNGAQNELDVVFIYENAIYIIECKTSLKEGNEDFLNETLYKISALQKGFGLAVNSYLFTLDNKLRDDNGCLKDHIQKRVNLLGVKIIDRTILKDGSKLNKELDNIFNRTKK